jgi:hypothetical protein
MTACVLPLSQEEGRWVPLLAFYPCREFSWFQDWLRLLGSGNWSLGEVLLLYLAQDQGVGRTGLRL